MHKLVISYLLVFQPLLVRTDSFGPTMISTLVISALGFAALSAGQSPTVGEGYILYPVTPVTVGSSDLAKRQDSVDLANVRVAYLITLNIGTPAQPVLIQLDTGSDECWVRPICTPTDTICNQLPKFDPKGSSTQTNLNKQGSIQYGSGSVKFDYVSDFVAAGCTLAPFKDWGTFLHCNLGLMRDTAAKVKAQQFGIAYQSPDLPFGILGVGPITYSDEPQYDRFITSLAKQGFTKSRAFSLDLRDMSDTTGTCIWSVARNGN